MRMICKLLSICTLVISPAGSGNVASYDAANGIFGSESCVGSDHWFASFTQSALT